MKKGYIEKNTYRIIFEIAAIVISVILYGIICNSVIPDNPGLFVVLGFIGAVMTGAGLFNAADIWIHRYKWRLRDILCVLGGMVIVLLSLFLPFVIAAALL